MTTIYTRFNCALCELAKKALDIGGELYEEVDVLGEPSAEEKLAELTDGAMVVPVLVEDSGEVRVGFGGVCGGKRGLRRWLWLNSRRRLRA
jgi:glutaredoxin